MTQITRLPANARMSAAAVVNGIVYTKGITALGGPSDIEGQTKWCLDLLDTLVTEAGSSKDNIIQIMIWLRDMDDFGAMNAIYDQWVLQGNQPVRACVEARLAQPQLLIEIQALAAI